MLVGRARERERETREEARKRVGVDSGTARRAVGWTSAAVSTAALEEFQESRIGAHARPCAHHQLHDLAKPKAQ